MTPAEFLAVLWGTTLPRGLRIQIWELERRRSGYLRAPAGAGGLEGRRDLYTAVALVSERSNLGPRQRARADQAAAIAGLWLDVDVDSGPDSKTGAAPDRPAALALACAVAEPTLLVSSGYGIHAWYLLAEPWRFASAAEQHAAAVMSAQFYALHRALARKRGWTIDHAHDLARLLRLPGTINGKGGDGAPVELLNDAGPRHDRGNLQTLCATAGDVPIGLGGGDVSTGSALPDVVVRSPRVDEARLEALLELSPEFAGSWRLARGENWSLSEYDLSIATHAAQAGWTDQEIADLIAYHRLLRDPRDTKATRRDYLRRTVAKAHDARERAGAARDAAQLVLGATAEARHDDAARDAARLVGGAT